MEFLQLWPNGWMDQDATWQRGRPRPRPHCIIGGSSGDPAPTAAPPQAKRSPISISATAELLYAYFVAKMCGCFGSPRQKFLPMPRVELSKYLQNYVSNKPALEALVLTLSDGIKTFFLDRDI